MWRYIGIILLIIVFSKSINAQEVSGFHDVQPGTEPNEYNIKTTIKGLEGVDIARIKYVIDSKHTYKASSKNGLFSDRNESYIKFYIMAVPASGELNIDLGIVVADGAEYQFPVEFQYSRNEEKQTIFLPKISVSGDAAIVAKETPEPVVEEVPIVEEAVETVTPEPVETVVDPPVEAMVPVVIPVVENNPVVEEAPEVVETPEPIVEEVPEVVETPEPIVEEVPEAVENVVEPPVEVAVPVVIPVVENTPVMEEVPEVVETPEPVIEEVPEVVETPAPVVEETPAPVEVTTSSKKYTVQLLSLSDFSQSRLNTFCKKHKLKLNDVKKRQVGGLTKITFGEANSLPEAVKIQERLMRENGITDSFVTQIK